MEDKTFDLIGKLYGEFSEFRKDTKEDILGVKNDIVRLENKIDSLAAKLEKQQVEIKVIKGGKDK